MQQLIQLDKNLELYVTGGKQIKFFNGPAAVKYQFGASNANWFNQGLVNMGILSFGMLSVSIQRNGNSLELDAGTGAGPSVDLRVSDTIEYSFGNVSADFVNNDLVNLKDLKFGIADSDDWVVSATSDDITFAPDDDTTTFFLKIGTSGKTVEIGNKVAGSVVSPTIGGELEGVDSTFITEAVATVTAAGSSTKGVIEMLTTISNGNPITARPLFQVVNGKLSPDIVFEVNPDNVSLKGNDIIDVTKIEFQGSDNNIEAVGGSDLTMSGDEKVVLFCNDVDGGIILNLGNEAAFDFLNNELNWKPKIDTIPFFRTRHRQTTPSSEPVVMIS